MIYLSSVLITLMLVFYILYLKTHIDRYDSLYDLFFILYMSVTYLLQDRYQLTTLTRGSFIAASYIVIISIIFLTLALKIMVDADKNFFFVISIFEFVLILSLTISYIHALILNV